MILLKDMKSFNTLSLTLKHTEIKFGDVLDRKRSFLDSKSMHGI